MKKLALVSIVVLLVLSIGQSIYASGSISVGAGYLGFTESSFNKNEKGFKTNLALKYEFSNHFSILGGASLSFVTDEDDYSYFIVNPGIYGRYDFFASKSLNAGIQLGASYNFTNAKDDLGDIYSTDHTITADLGAFVEYYATPELKLYVDVRVPAFLVNWNSVTTASGTEFFDRFLFNIMVGCEVYITPNVFFGVEHALESEIYKMDDITGPQYTFGLKLGCKF